MIAVDWGTSSFRAYRLSSDGAILEKREAAKGILSVPAGLFPLVLEQQVGDWISAGESPIVMSGMVGSRQGWSEAPYAPCPAGYDEIAASLHKVEWEGKSAWIVPGLTCRDEAGVPDVMRGEETQILGALDQFPPRAVVCLPGTHSKWVVAEEGRITGFRTFFTGETFAVLKGHSLLGRMMEEGSSEPAFLDGVARSGDEGGLLHHLFGVRTRGLFGELPNSQASSYLSGLLIGHEMRTARDAGRVYLLGAPALTALYAKAGTLIGITTKLLDPEAATGALYRLGQTI